MEIDFKDVLDDQDNETADELYIDYMIDLGMDDEAIDLTLNALESGDYERIQNSVPANTTNEEIDDLISLYIDYVEAEEALESEDDFEGDMSEAVLTLAQRRKKALTMRRFKTKLKAARKRMSRRAAPADVIARRSRRAAIKTIRAKVAGNRGKDYANLTPGEKSVIDQRVAKRKAAVDRLAKRMVNQVRRADRDRLNSKSKKTNESVDQDFATFTRPFKEIEPEFPVDSDESAKPLGWYNGIVKQRWLPHFKIGGDADRRYAMFKNTMYEDRDLVAVMDEANLMGIMETAECAGVDVQNIIESFELSLTESHADNMKDAIQELVKVLAIKTNLAEQLSAISEDRLPNLVCEDTGDSCMFISQKQIKMFEKICDEMFKKFDIDFTFTKHFADRMSDSRNTPCLTLKELANFVKKMYADAGKKLKDNKNTEAVLKDVQSNINIPVVIEYDRKNDDFEVVLKTVMRKKNFSSSSKTVAYR